MADDKTTGPAAFLSIGVFIALGAAAGLMLGAIMGDLMLWMGIGAAVGVVAGAIFESNRAGRRSGEGTEDGR